MPKRTSTIWSGIKRTLRFVAYFLLAITLLINVYIVLSGRFYIYKGVRHTYLVGQAGPGIYELNIFPYNTISKAEKTEKWVKPKRFNTKKLSAKDTKYLKKLDTRAFLVFHGDSIIYENYMGEHHVNTVSNSFSAAKTVVALLVGVAIEEGKIKSLDEPAGNYLKAYNSGGKEKITIRHLLMMASGLDWEESASNPLSENAESYYGTDLLGLVNRQQAITQPGKHFNYQSGNSQLLGFIIEKATGKTLSDYAQEKLWKKIGTEHDAYWSLDKENGDEKAFCCMYATARDFGRIGKLILQKGKWGNAQVVPLWYMQELERLPEMSTDEGVPNYRYGLHIWEYVGEKNPIYYCRGIKGQYVISIPSENLVIVRLGLQRKKDITIPEIKKNNQKYIDQIKYKVGHPSDFFEFVRMGRWINSQ